MTTLTNYNGVDFGQAAHIQANTTGGGATPPDPEGAVGPNSYIEEVNLTVAMFSPKTSGINPVTDAIDDFFNYQGALPDPNPNDVTGNSFSDPSTLFDEQTQRFIVSCMEVDPSSQFGSGFTGDNSSVFDFAVSKSSNPLTLTSADWNFYQIRTTEPNFFSDFPGNIGYNDGALVLTLNEINPSSPNQSTDHVLVTAINMSDITNGVSQANLHFYQTDFQGASLRPATMHDSTSVNDPMWFVQEHPGTGGLGDGQNIDVVRMDDVLNEVVGSTPHFTTYKLAVNPYTDVSLTPPKQADGSVVTPDLDSRILKVAERNGLLVATHSVSVSSTEDDAQWYIIGVSSGTPSLQQQGDVSGGNNTYITYPGIDINQAGDIGMSYMQSGTDNLNDWLSMYITGRTPTDPKGTMETPILEQAGQQVYQDFGPASGSESRAGDLSGINVDAQGNFWTVNEFADNEPLPTASTPSADWGTNITSFTFNLVADLTVTASGPATVTPGGTATYTITLTNNGPNAAQNVVLSDTLPTGAVNASLTPTPSNPDGFSFTLTDGVFTSNSVTVANGKQDTFTINVSVPSSLASGVIFDDIASVTSTTTDPNPYDNAATVAGSTGQSITISTNYNAASYQSTATILGGVGSTPPDNEGAVGPNSFVEAVNDEIAIFAPRTSGANPIADSLDNFFATTGGLPDPNPKDSFGNFITDPFVIFDEQTQRFIVGCMEVDPGPQFTAQSTGDNSSVLDLAVSKTSNPASLKTTDWNFYQLRTTEANKTTGINYLSDYPGNAGYNGGALVVTVNEMSPVTQNPDHVLVNAINMSDLTNGVAQASLRFYQTDFQGMSLRPTTMHDSTSANDPMWFVQEHLGANGLPDNQNIDVVRMDDVLNEVVGSTPHFTTYKLAVNPYTQIAAPLQPDGSMVTDYLDSRIMKVAEQGGTLVAAHSVSNAAGNQDLVQWYQISLSGGTPVLNQQGDLGAGPNTYLYFPGIDINPAGDIGMSYMQSGTDNPNDFMSMYVTGRTPSDPSGTLETPVLVQAGQQVYEDYAPAYAVPQRAGDLSGINVDSAGNFWAINEFADGEALPTSPGDEVADPNNPAADWGTDVVSFTLPTRTVLSPYVVTKTTDDGSTGTLRDAINQVNAGTVNEIDFNIAGTGVQTINLTSQLPTLTASGIFINGLSQGGSGNTKQLIELNGSGAGSTSDGLLLQGSNDMVSGLIIEHFNNGVSVSGSNNTIGGAAAGAGNVISGNTGAGVQLSASGATVQGNYIGTDVSGTTAAANSIGILVSAGNITIGGTATGQGNVISGNSGDGVDIASGVSGVLVEGNYIGTNSGGAVAVANLNGIEVAGASNTIGGSFSGARNVLSGNSNDGMRIDSGASGNQVLGNFIGADTTGAKALPNHAGVEVAGNTNTIGGTSSGALNLISGNSTVGLIIDSSVSGVSVQGNYIGANATGATALANGTFGVDVEGSSDTIGGALAGAGNVISGNTGDGVHLGGSASGVTVQGNYIGTDATGANPLGNSGNGVNIAGKNNTVGAGNVISANSKNGVLVSSGSGNTITQNSIFANTGLGISLASGANNNIAAPTISSTSLSGSKLTVKGTFSAATANVPYVLEFYGSPNGDAEGKAYIRSLTVTSTSTGTQSFTFSTTTAVPTFYPLITATLTNNSGDTSQFSTGVSSATIYVVTSAADSGSGTLRDAVTQANNTANGITVIDFAIGKSGSAQTISLASALPALTANGVFINGLSQGGLSSTAQLITLNGTNAGSSDGMLLQGSSDVVSGLIIEHFSKNGIEVSTGTGNIIGGTVTGAGDILSGNSNDGLLIDSGARGNQVLGNFVGIIANGSALGNSGNGIEIAGAGNTVGGAAAAARNILSANSKDGVLLDSTASSNQVLGNYIGANAGGNAALANSIGIEDAGSGNTLGGSVSGARNVISGNSNDGVLLDSTASGNQVLGNFLGLNASGATALGNSGNGLEIKGTNNTIGGPVLAARNYISGNKNDGLLFGSSASGNQVLDNFIGLDVSGTHGVANLNGLEIAGSNNTIGGSISGYTNVLSANKNDGVLLDSTASGNLIQGNDVGTDYSGQKAVGNSIGIEVMGSGNTLGGTASAARNIVSGNSADGVRIDSGANKMLLLGNFIGVNALDAALANSGNGLDILSTNNTIGGTAAGARNVLSGNNKDGLLLASGASGNQVIGNYIGANIYGTAGLGNRTNGIEIASNGNTVGGTAAAARNIISGNTNDGVLLDSTASGNQVLGNYIGINHAGTGAVANKVGIEDAGSGNILGGSVSGARNVISGNSNDGILLDSTAKGESVQGNFLGLNAGYGNAALANGNNGLEVQGANNTIGGTVYFERNFISGNTKDGLFLGSSASGNLVLNNFIGIDLSGTHGVANLNGVEIAGAGNTLGGTISGYTNVLSANKNDGVLLDSTASANLIQGDDVGTDYTGKVAVANSSGIEIAGSGNTLGGTVSTARNIISGNSSDGVRIDAGASGNLVLGNYIGLNYSSVALANSGNGLNIAGNKNTVGGTASGARNIISGNSKDGLLLASGASGNQVLGSYIGTNPTGTAAVGNSNGIEVAGNSNTVGGAASGARNILSGNSNDGLLIDGGASGNVVLGNYIGINAAGTAAVSDSKGVELAGSGNTVGGTATAARNIISGNSNDGVLLDSTASGNQVLGNYIGINNAGNGAVANKVGIEDAGSGNTLGGSVNGARNFISGNSNDGVLLDSTAKGEAIQGNYIGLNTTGYAALVNSGNGVEIKGVNNTVGGNSGSNYYVRNFISGNKNDGVLIDSGATGNQVVGNFIGLDISGTHGVANLNGVEIAGNSNTLGSTVSGNKNVISGNSNDGVLIDNTAANSVLQGNDVGTDYTGQNVLVNSGNGVEIAGSNNMVGGSVSGAGNVIANNSKDGVLVSAGSGNTIRRNSIYNDVAPGISLASGANNNIVAPTLSSAKLSGSTLTVTESFTAPTANVNYVLEFFANPTGDAEGKIYLGSLTVTSATTGAQSVTFTATTTVTGANPLITATLTDNVGDTSPFSNGVTVSVLATKVNAPNASSSFSFQLLNRNVGGLTSTTLGNSPTALSPASGVGDGLDQTGGVDPIGLYINGVAPINAGAIDLSGAGINQHSGDTFNVRMTYNGTSFMVKTTDVRTGDSAMEDILRWTYSTRT
jgi:hypothetical protein